MLSARRKQLAGGCLAYRAQCPEEIYVTYINDVLSLCRPANTTMTKADKVGDILEGVSDYGLKYLMARIATTVSGCTEACHRLNETKRDRVLTGSRDSKHHPPYGTFITSPHEGVRNLIQDIFSEELRFVLTDNSTALNDAIDCTTRLFLLTSYGRSFPHQPLHRSLQFPRPLV